MQELIDIIPCVLLINMKESINHSFDDFRSGGGCPLPTTSTTESLDSLSATIDFIICWLKAL